MPKVTTLGPTQTNDAVRAKMAQGRRSLPYPMLAEDRTPKPKDHVWDYEKLPRPLRPPQRKTG